VLCLPLLGGCTHYFTETNPEPEWDKSRLKEVQHENAVRLLGEDKSPTTASDVVFYVPNQLWRGMSWTADWTFGNRPIKFAVDLYSKDADTRRLAVYELSDHPFGRRKPYTDGYAIMGRDDVDPTVRAAGIRALNRARAQQYTSTYIHGLNDDNEWVRTEAAKALANIPDSKAIPDLIRLMGDGKQTRDIRLASADALRSFPQSDVAQALIRTLNDRDFGLAWQARQSLNLMTGQDFRYDQAKWLNYLTTTPNPYVGMPGTSKAH
jgi:hypothetical protein